MYKWLEENGAPEILWKRPPEYNWDQKTADDTSWPDPPRHCEPPIPAAYSIKGVPLKKCFLGVARLADPADLPAHVSFGGWNACPLPWIHVAFLRTWRDRFGAVPISMTKDTVEVFIERPPTTPQEAHRLERELMAYAEEVNFSGMPEVTDGSVERWALPYWHFWWD
jgi:hypothetical protein